MRPPARIEIETLEPRILFSADVNTLVQALNPATDPASAEVRLVTPDVIPGQSDETSQPALTSQSVVSHAATELIIVDQSVLQDQLGLVEQLMQEDLYDSAGQRRTFEIRTLSSDQDGLDQLSGLLSESTQWSAVHLISHGGDGKIQLGNSFIDSNTLRERQDQVASLSRIFGGERDFLLYGCDLAADEQGRAFLQELGRLTQTDVAANTGATGQDDAGSDEADWTLDYQSGTVRTALALSVAIQNDWQGILATFTVTNTNDSGAGSLRAAINSANSTGGTDNINFNISGVGVHTITPLTALPTINEAVNIDGTTQPGYATGSPKIELSGALAGAGARGLDVSSATGMTIRGLVVNRFQGIGIAIGSGSNITIAGNIIGLDASGTVDLGNGDLGIYLNASNSLIGGIPVSERNIVSGNGSNGIFLDANSGGTSVFGNYLGTDITGMLSLGNTGDGVTAYSATGLIIGSQAAGSGNLISGNGSNGVGLYGSGGLHSVQGNTIGLAVDGNTALGNGQSGISIDSNSNNLIGSGTASGRNVISGNLENGIFINNSNANLVMGNWIGRNASNTATLGNVGNGIQFWTNADNSIIGGINTGEGNIIAGSGGSGIAVFNTSSGNAFLGNTIYGSAGLGIDLGGDSFSLNDGAFDWDLGPNNLQNFPVLFAASISSGNVTITGNIATLTFSDFVIDYYSSPVGLENATGYGEGAVWLGSQTISTDGFGNASVNIVLPAASMVAGDRVSAVATLSHGGGSYGSSSEFAMNVVATSTNVAPVIAGTSGDNVGYFEGASPVIVDAGNNNVVTDVDSPNFSGGSLQVTISGGLVASEDVLSIRHQGNAAGQIGVSGSIVSYGGVAIGTFSIGAAGAPLLISFNASATPAAATALLRNITYENTNNSAPVAGGRSLSYVINDGDGGTSAIYGSTVSVIALNDPPVINFGEGDKTFVENGSAIFIDALATISDVDNTNFAGGHLQVSVPVNGWAFDAIAINNQGTGAGQIGVSGANVTYGGLVIGTWSGSGAPLDVSLNSAASTVAVQALMRNITYIASGQDPFSATRVVQFQLSDGSGGNSLAINKNIAISLDNTIWVTTTADTADGDTTNMASLLANPGADGRISLREAILISNNTAGPNQILFNIPDALVSGAHTIALSADLQYITGSTLIDATTDADWAANGKRPVVVIDGNGIATDGLVFSAGSNASVVRGLVIRDMLANGIRTEAGADGITIAGNYLGAFDTTGSSAGAGEFNGNSGVLILSSGNTVGGINPGDQNVISGNAYNGVGISAGSGNTVINNLIGTDADGLTALGNGGSGVYLVSGANNNQIGSVGYGNVIAGSQFDGVSIIDFGTGLNRIQSNAIGTSLNGLLNLGNQQEGIDIFGGTANNTIGGVNPGEGNLIFFNGASTFAGISVQDSSIGNAILGNEFHSNGQLAINLSWSTGPTPNDADDSDSGANSLQNFPVLTTARTNSSNQLILTGTLSSAANSFYRIEFFASATQDSTGYGEGRTFLGFANVATDGAGNTSISTTLSANVASGAYISATATLSDASYSTFTDTSEFARNIAAVSSTQAVISVDTTGDTSDGDTTSLSTLLANKGADGVISLREAIIAANNTVNGTQADKILFTIAGTGAHSINLASALPDIVDGVIIDASSDDSFAANGNRPAIILEGNHAFLGHGFVLEAGSGGSTIRGLVIRGFAGAGVTMTATSDGNTIAGNYIGGFDTNGSNAGPPAFNNSHGIYIESRFNTIGGNTAADRNLIGGNGLAGIMVWGGGSDNRILGNYIGLSADGLTVNGNGYYGIELYGAGSNIIGGTAPGAANVISGQFSAAKGGLFIVSGNNLVQGNIIGLDASGTIVIGNAAQGIEIWDGSNNRIGGTAPGAGNLVAGNGLAGVNVDAMLNTGNAILGNRIFGNGGLGIDLASNSVTANDAGDTDAGPNNLLNFPVILSAVTSGLNTQVSGFINSTANTNLRLEFFGNAPGTGDPSGYGEGAIFLGFVNVTTDSAGNANFNSLLVNGTTAAGQLVSATATVDLGGGIYGDTSEFSQLRTVSNSGPAINVTPLLGFNTGELGGTAQFSVVLSAAPTADVTIDVSVSDSTEGSVNTNTLTFTTANWNIAQTLVVTGVDEPAADGDKNYFLTLAPAVSADPAYNGINLADVLLKNIDNDFYNTLVVTTTSDIADGNTSSIEALMANMGADGRVSLREALLAANATSNGPGGADRIYFNIPEALAGGAHTIQPTSALPTIGDAVVIDGTTDPDFAGKPVIVLDGSLAGSSTDGLTLAVSGNAIWGLVINQFGDDGIQINSNNNSIAGNFIGTDVTGTLALGNGDDGIDVVGGGNQIGTATAGSRNLISGNTGDAIQLSTGAIGNTIRNNFLGTDRTGVLSLANGGSGIHGQTGTSANTIGGTASTQGNVISGNAAAGVRLDAGSTGYWLYQNLIGTDASGLTALGNSTGLMIDGSNHIVGAGSAAQRNVISGNANAGIALSSTASNNTLEGNAVGLGVNLSQALGNGGDGIDIQGTGNVIRSGVISANGGAGVAIAGSANFIQNNIIGLDGSGALLRGNTNGGVEVIVAAADNQIGGLNLSDRNIISGNAAGIILYGGTRTVIQNNYIGTDSTGLLDRGNTGMGISVASDGNIIGGTNASAGNVIAGNDWVGLAFVNATSHDNVAQGNIIGLGSDGNTGLGNSAGGVSFFNGATNNQLGGSIPGSGNIVSANSVGVYVSGLGTTGNIMQGNLIGTDATGVQNRGNSFEGVLIDIMARGNLIGGINAGQGNTIANSGASNVAIRNNAGIANAVLGNRIYGSAALGIDLDNPGVLANDAQDSDAGGNSLQNYPVLSSIATDGSSVLTVLGSLDSAPNAQYRIEFFASPTANASGYGEGQRYLGFVNVTTDGSGHATINATLSVNVASGEAVSATATASDPGFTSFTDTSEFSQSLSANISPGATNLSAAEVYAEDTPLNLVDIVITDPDGTTASVTLTLSNPAAGVLSTAVSGAVASSFSAGVWTASGLISDLNILLAGLTFTPSSNFSTTFSISTSITDSAGATLTGVKVMSATGVNDAPMASDDRLSLSFDGVDDYVSVVASPALTMSSSLTLEAWINPVASGNAVQIIANKEGEYEIGLFADGSLNFAVAEGGIWSWHSTGVTVGQHVWTHVAITYDTGTVNTYINGVIANSQATLTNTIDDAHPTLNEFRIGGRSNNPAGQYFAGQIADVRVWSIARTQAEIAGTMNTTLTGSEAGLAGYWTLADGNGLTASDRSANNNPGTLVNGTAWSGYRMDEDGTLVVPAAGVLANDFDADGNPLTAILVSGPSHGSLSLNSDGSFTYTPVANWYGTDSFSYKANDGLLDSNVATVNILVNPVNDAPVADGLPATLSAIAEDALNPAGTSVGALFSAHFADVLDSGQANTNQFAGIAVRGYSQTLPEGLWQYSQNAGSSWLAFGAVSDSTALVLAASDLIRFLPAADYFGSPSGTLSVRLLDNSSLPVSGSVIDVSAFNSTSSFSSALISLSTLVTPVNDAPNITSNGGGNNNGAGVADINLAENSTGPITTVLATDIDSPAASLSFSITGGSNASLFTIDATSGVLSLDTSQLPGGLNYESPVDVNKNGIYLVRVTVSDGAGGTDTQMIRVRITDQPERPTSIAGSLLSINENTDTSAGVIVMTSAGSSAASGSLATSPLHIIDPDSADVHTLSIVGGADAASFSLQGTPGNYQLVFHAGLPNFEAQSVYQVTLRATDPSGLFVDRTFSLDMLDVNEAPALHPLSVTIDENPLASQLLGSMNFTDPDGGDSVSVRILPPAPGSVDAALLSALNINAAGEVFVANPALFDFETSRPGFTDHSLSLNVEITDSKGLSSVAVLQVTLRDVNEAPTDVTATIRLFVYSPGEVVAKLNPADPDNAEQFTYSIVSDPGGYFALDAKTGTMTLSPQGQSRLNSDATETVVVSVRDKAGMELQRTFRIKVPGFLQPQAGTDFVTVTNTGGLAAGLDIFLNNVSVISSEASTDASAPRGGTVSSTNKNNSSTARSNAAAPFAIADPGLATPEENGTMSDRRASGTHSTSRPGLYNAADARSSALSFAERRANQGATPTTRELIEDFRAEDLSNASGNFNLSNTIRGFETRRPEIQGRLAPFSNQDSDAETHSEGLIGLIGREPLYVASAIISTGAVWWAARGLALMTSLIMGTPVWRQMDMLPVVLKPSHSFEPTAKADGADQDTQLETVATRTFFNDGDGSLEEEAVGSLFEVPVVR